MTEPEEIRAETSPPLGGRLRPVERSTTIPLRRVSDSGMNAMLVGAAQAEQSTV